MLLAVLATGCKGLPRGLSPEPRSGTAPSARPAEGQTSRGQTSVSQSAYLVAEEWTDFSRTVLWPQTWALRHWHHFEVKAGAVNLSPSGPVPAAPEMKAEALGGDPPVWRLGWKASSHQQPGPVRKVQLTPEQTAGVPPAVAAVRRAVLETGLMNGEVRVVSEALGRAGFSVEVEFR